MTAVLDALLGLLDLEELEVNLFRGGSPQEGSQRVFGGQVLGQALVAAGRTVPAERPAHSLHAYFLRPGDPAVPILYQVDRTRDERSFTTRRVTAIQRGQAIFHLDASCHVDEAGPAHQAESPEAPEPESLPTSNARMVPVAARVQGELGSRLLRARPIDLRHVLWFDPIDPEKLPPRLLVSVRAAGA